MKRLLFLFLILIACLPAGAQKRVSLVTCGTGDELYSLFGHAAIRIIDTARGTDEVYNYGTFNGFEENFEIKYLRGKLLYYLAKESFPDFLNTYIAEGRSVQEQELLLDSAAKQRLYEALEENLLPQNAAYKYDFLYDNCATRIRDIFPKAIGPEYQAGGADSIPYKTFRNSIDDYLKPRLWEKFGIDILLGSPVDKPVSPMTMQYLPDYLRSGVAHSLFRGKSCARPAETLLPGAAHDKIPFRGPLLLNFALLTISAILWSARRWHIAAEIFGRSLFFITGLLGLLLLFMWFGTDHQACSLNWNFLWLMPLSVVGAFLRGKWLCRYLLFASAMLLLAFVIHLFGVQELPLRAGWPLLLALCLNYGMIYRLSLLRKTAR